MSGELSFMPQSIINDVNIDLLYDVLIDYPGKKMLRKVRTMCTLLWVYGQKLASEIDVRRYKPSTERLSISPDRLDF